MGAEIEKGTKTDYPELLNNLDEMQQSHHYAARRQVLMEAERIILKLEREVRLLKSQNTSLALLDEMRKTIKDRDHQIVGLERTVAGQNAHVESLMGRKKILEAALDVAYEEAGVLVTTVIDAARQAAKPQGILGCADHWAEIRPGEPARVLARLKADLIKLPHFGVSGAETVEHLSLKVDGEYVRFEDVLALINK
jgi:hypothetical protein